MRDLMTTAQQVRDYVREGPLPDSYMVWVDIFMQPSQFVLVGFSIATRILLSIVFGILGLILGLGVRPGQGLQQLRVLRSAAGAEGIECLTRSRRKNR